jgi:anti-anti-sigma factor
MLDQPHVTHFQHDDAVVLSPIGEFDLSCVDILRDAALSAFRTTNLIVVDLSRTTFLDSTALGVIVAVAKRAQEKQGWLRLVAPRANVHKIILLMGLDGVLGMYDTVDQALAHKASESVGDEQSTV